MNIAAIYDKYDLWGKVRVSAGSVIGPSYKCTINGDITITRSGNTLHDAIQNALKDYIKCEYCEGDGVVPNEPYTALGNIPDCDTVRCKECGGSGERKYE